MVEEQHEPATTPAPPVMSPPSPASQLTIADRVRLAHGFYGVFFGMVITLAALAEILAAPVLRLFYVFACGSGVLSALFGALQLRQVATFGTEWKRRSLGLLALVGLCGYLFPFFCLWRKLPGNIYLLCHALGFIVALISAMTLLGLTVSALGRAVGRRSLVILAVICSALTIVLLLAPFALLSQAMIATTLDGRDPLILLQFILDRAHPLVLVALLLPFSLTLSLTWEAKDIALDCLLKTKPNGTPPPSA